MHKAAVVGLIGISVIAIAACGGATRTVTVSQTPTPAQTSPAKVYVGPSCTTVDAANGAGYSMCDPRVGATTMPCPTGWQPGTGAGVSNCEPDPTYSASNTGTGNTDGNTGAGNTGTNTGTTDPYTFKDAAPGKWLKLSTLHAKIEHVSIQHEIGSDVGVKVAHGKFVVITLSVTDRSDTPQSFDGMGTQTQLVLANQKNYSENFAVGNGIDQNSFIWNSDDIQPDTTVTHNLIFEVPAKAVVANGTLAVLNFGADTTSLSSGDEVGRIQLGSLA